MSKIKTLFSIRSVLLGLLACSMLSCSDDLDVKNEGVKGAPHDPSKPIEVTGFEPETGSSGQQMVIFGKNFGNDPASIRVSVGGSEATVISATGDAIYCLVPERSVADDFDGFEDGDEEYATENDAVAANEADGSRTRTIHVGVGAYGFMQEASFEEKLFEYVKTWKVRTLAGKVNEKRDNDNRTDKYPLPFSDCGNFPMCENFTVDPVNNDHVWLSGKGEGGIRLFDLKERTVTFFATPMSDWQACSNSVRKIDFTHDENHHMIVAIDEFTYDLPTIFLIKRNSPTESGVKAFMTGGTINAVGLVNAYNLNGVAVHPKTNSIFYPKWGTAEVYKFPNCQGSNLPVGDKNNIYTWLGQSVPENDVNRCQPQFGFGETRYEMFNFIHPDGKYMYVLCSHEGFIAKSLYNESEDTFSMPCWFVNSARYADLGGGPGYVNDIGMNAKMNGCREGVFVKNPEYVAQGRTDVYDFYLTDQMNHCIRKVTPEGVVTTFSGRGRISEGTAYGTADGLARSEAMFDQPLGITYSPKRNAFYIGDHWNKLIREIYFD